MNTTTRSTTSVAPVLYVAFELGAKQWKLAMTPRVDGKPWTREMRAADWPTFERMVVEARRRFGLAETTRVVSCYEAGRDGFWIHRALLARGVANRVVDSASIEVNRRARRKKTDRLEAVKLVLMLMRACAGEPRVWSEVRVPTVAAETARLVSRERSQLVAERTRVVNQIRGWLATWGCSLPSRRPAAWWTTIRDWAGQPLPPELQQRLARAHERVQLLAGQVLELERQQRAAVQAEAGGAAARLAQLKGLATTSVSILLDEGLVWRQFRNRREVGGFLGYTAVPHQSGDTARDVGIDRAGNQRVRVVSLQLAWQWVRHQPASALTQWYRRRFADHGRRARLIGIVAVARKLCIALWRWATRAELPAGALLKAV